VKHGARVTELPYCGKGVFVTEPVCARTVGGPGAGKTDRGKDIVVKAVEVEHLGPFQVGFVSFTRAARREAAERLAGAFGCKVDDLEKEGWFRTLHSACYRLLGVARGELITSEDTRWLRDVLQDERVRLFSLCDDEALSVSIDPCSTGGRALAIWGTARNRLIPVSAVWEALCECDDRLPPLYDIYEMIERYEEAKARDGRLDFTDLLMRYSGLRWTGDHDSPYEKCPPDGGVPVIPVYVHDEAQDMSALTARVFRRLIQGSKWVYLIGDNWQSVFGFAGADGSIFANWPVVKEEMLPVSHRCRSKILARAQAMMNAAIRPTRDFKARYDGGEVIVTDWNQAMSSVKAGEDTLILCRTNDLVKEAAALLDDALVPWKPVKGSGGFAAPARAAGVKAILDLKAGLAIDGLAMSRLFDLLPSKKDGVEFLVRGAKKRMEDDLFRSQAASTLAMLDLFGATEALKQAIDRDGCKDLLEPPARLMVSAGLLYGSKALETPSVRVSTIHCSPPDEKVLSNQGWISIGELEPGRVRLAGYYRKSNKLIWGGTSGNGAKTWSKRGYTWQSFPRDYFGPMLTITTSESCTRVTPNHRLEVRVAQDFLGKFVVYLMRRGDWWRIGVTVTGQKPYISSGVGCRLAREGGDSAWIIGIYSSKEEALFEESRLKVIHGIPDATFEPPGRSSGEGTASPESLYSYHESLKEIVAPRARLLLASHGMSEDLPLYSRRSGKHPDFKQNKMFLGTVSIAAANFMTGFMLMPTVPESFCTKPAGIQKPVWLPGKVSREEYAGTVYDLSVPPHEHYISGRAVVHNSAKGLEADHVVVVNSIPLPTQRAIETQEGLAEERRLWYVAGTRARHRMTIAQMDEPFPEM
jgi:superfamily I DNA/RNA helicase